MPSEMDTWASILLRQALVFIIFPQKRSIYIKINTPFELIIFNTPEQVQYDLVRKLSRSENFPLCKD